MWGGSHNESDFLPAGDGCAQIDFLFSLPHSVKGPELINMYVGQSEENVRNGEDVRPAPACGEMGLFWSAAGKEVVLKPPFPTPTQSSQQELEPSCLLQSVVWALAGPILLGAACPQSIKPLGKEQLVVVIQRASGFHPQLFPAGNVSGSIAVDCSSTSFSLFVLSPHSVCQSQGSCSLHYLL